MKLNFGKKVLLLVHCLLALLIAFVLAALVIMHGWNIDLISRAYNLLGLEAVHCITVGAMILYCALATSAVSAVFSRGKKRGERGLITVDSTESGRTRISVAAIEQMIRQAVRSVDGIAEMKCAITNDDDAISVNATVTLLAGAHVPTVTMGMQRAIRNYMELNCGVAVREICVNVTSVDSGEGKRSSRRNLTAAAPMPAAEEAAPEPVCETAPAEEIASEDNEISAGTDAEEA